MEYMLDSGLASVIGISMNEKALIPRRPALLACMILTVGVITSGAIIDKGMLFNNNENFLLSIIILTVTGAIVFVYITHFYGNKALFFLFLVGVFTMLVNTSFLLGFSGRFTGTGTVISRESIDESQRLVIKLDTGSGIFEKRVILYNKSSVDYAIGDILYLNGDLDVPDIASNPNCFNYRKYLFSQGISLVGDNVSLEIRAKSGNGYLRLKEELIKRRDRFINSFLDNEVERSLAMGILFGRKSDIPEDLYSAFRETGSSHILAVSGLHIGIVYGVYDYLLKRIKRERLRTVFTAFFSAILFCYGTITLWSPSVTRAILMVASKLVQNATDRRYDMLSTLSLINMGILIIRPYSVYSAGFQMSFLAAYALSIIAPRLRGRVPALLIPGVSVHFFLIPYMLYMYNEISIISILINIVSVYIAALYVPIGVVGFTVFFLIGQFPGYRMLGESLGGIGNMLAMWTEISAADGRFRIQTISPKYWVIFAGIMIFAYLFSEISIISRERKDIKRMLSLMVAFLYGFAIFVFIGNSPFDSSAITFIDVGQGDSIHVSWGNQVDFLIDGGGRYDYNVGREILRPYLLRNGTSDIDIALATHTHMDHYKGIEELKDEGLIDKVLTEGYSGDSIELSDEKKVRYLWPLPEYEGIDDENYYSRVYMIEYEGIKVLVTGDITEEGEKELLKLYEKSGLLNCDILKVAHHGSRFSSSLRFLEACSPSVAVISVGMNNNYGHPHNEIIEKISDLGIIIYRTDLDGAVGVIPKKNGFAVCTAKTMKYDYYTF